MKNNKIGELTYNSTSGRWCLSFDEYYVELHCGDCFLIKLKNKRWEAVRIEYKSNGGWYLVTEIGDIAIPNYPCKVKEDI